MRSFIAFTAVFTLSAVFAPLPASAEALLISAEKIYTSPEVEPLRNGSILLQDGRIKSVADERSRIRIPAGTPTSDCRGVVVAGFQNSHVHFTENLWNDAARAPVDRLNRGLESMLTRFGFTTVLDTGSDLSNTVALRKRIEKKELRGPRIFTAGLPLYPLDGIPFYIRDLPPDLLAKMHQPRSAAQARDQVRTNLTAGADATKLFLHTSPDLKNQRFISPEIARAAAGATHAHDKLVLAHPTSLEGLKTALAAGVDILVHTTLGEEAPWDEGVIAEMLSKHVSVIPTFKLWVYELRKGDVPPDVIERLLGATQRELRTFSSAGGQVLFGTDVGYMHEYDPTDEYVFMAQAGLTPAQILASLTTAPAQRWKEDKRRGRVEPGFDADLVVLEGDPADDVKNFARVRCAFRAGELIFSAKPL